MNEFIKSMGWILAKLGVIQQVLAAHGIVSDRPPQSISYKDMAWAWRRGDAALTVIFSNGEFPGVSLELLWKKGSRLWVDCVIRDHWAMQCKPLTNIVPDGAFADLCAQVDARQSPDRTSLDENTAREFMDTIAAFFAKLPVDAPAEAAATP